MMGKGSARLHDRTQISSEELADRWENTFKNNKGGVSDDGKNEVCLKIEGQNVFENST